MRTIVAIMRNWLFQTTSRFMSRCRVCGSARDVYVYDPRGLWAYFFRQTYCPAHCPDHDFQYDRWNRDWRCTTCDESAPFDWREP